MHYILKAAFFFGQHFDSEPPKKVNHIFLRQFESGSNNKIGTFMLKNQSDRATLTDDDDVISTRSDYNIISFTFESPIDQL